MYKNEHFLGHIATQFNSYTINVSSPPNKHKIIGHESMDPNELARIEIPRTGPWVGGVLNEVLKKYGAYGLLWKSGTGGGPGAPENYTDWMNRDDVYLNEYTNER